jgi:hypothetical protein
MTLIGKAVWRVSQVHPQDCERGRLDGSELAEHTRVKRKMKQWDKEPRFIVLCQLMKERVQKLGRYGLGVVSGQNLAIDRAG